MMRAKTTVLIVCFISGCLHQSAMAQQGVHLIIAADTISADIKECTSRNAINISDAILRNFPTGSVTPIVLRGRDCSSERIKQEFQRIPNISSASVFFYFCGHGFSTKNTGANLLFPIGQRNETAENIYQAIESRSPRLFVSVLDCCSVDPPRLSPGVAPSVKVRRTSPLARRLFYESAGVYHFYSSSHGQAALGHHRRGGATDGFFMPGSPFTSELSARLSDVNNAQSWSSIFESAKREAAAGFRKVFPRGVRTTVDGQPRVQVTQTPRLVVHQ